MKGEYDEEGEDESGYQRLVSYAAEITEIQSLCSTLISLPLLCMYMCFCCSASLLCLADDCGQALLASCSRAAGVSGGPGG